MPHSARRSDRPGSCTPLARCADPAHPRGPPRHRPPLYTGRDRLFAGDILRDRPSVNRSTGSICPPRACRAWLRQAASSACRAPLQAPPAAAHPKPRARHSAPFICEAHRRPPRPPPRCGSAGRCRRCAGRYRHRIRALQVSGPTRRIPRRRGQVSLPEVRTRACRRDLPVDEVHDDDFAFVA